MEAINQAPKPRNLSELRAFLGMVIFYGKFMENLSTLLAPLYKLLRKGVVWRWGRPQRQAFDGAKELLSSPKLLVHYDATKELILTCDASPYGLGAVLTHRMEDGTERPIEYASRTLAPAERNYAQIDKEALAIMYGVKRFHNYLYGRPFVICSDHKPYLPVRRAQGNIGNCISSSTAVGSQSHGLPILHCPSTWGQVGKCEWSQQIVNPDSSP